jgi:hypothetical protein
MEGAIGVATHHDGMSGAENAVLFGAMFAENQIFTKAGRDNTV